MQHVNTEILKENQNLINELKELTSITETWINSSNKINQCISEQILTQKKKILGIDQLTEDTSSSGPKDLVFVKSLTYNLNMSITSSNKPMLSEITIPNHDIGKVLLVESQRNTTNLSVAVTDSSATNYDSTDESSVCSTPLHPLEKLAGVKPVSGPKTIKSILKSNSTFKPKALKDVTLKEPSSTPAKDNRKGTSASKLIHLLLGESLKANKARANKTVSSNVQRSKTPTKRLNKSLYGLKQASKAWYETLSTNLTKHKFVRGPNLNGKAVNETQCRDIKQILRNPTLLLLREFSGYNMDIKCTSGACVVLSPSLELITNPPPTSNHPVLPAALRAQAVQELHELQRISAFVDSRLESIERFLNNFANQPNETNMNNIEFDDESVDTPLISPFPHSDNDSNNGEVLNELIEYENIGMLRREKGN
uniref:Reverse transcriptase Ty1/copia-type domain-containing protein n=1 Tax=Tanacetum cinerariifolium TaxID=118510 RepID=A0A6L2NLK4_TANCI|nr:hypothetical protein [Tanacetum cinerariifolium]